ncbi:MAG TPA: class I SAM-dependent DNA methyltransferase, partial [Micromonosporaceae bacterium]
MRTHPELAGLIWSAADLLRGDYKQSEYGRVILPLTLLRRIAPKDDLRAFVTGTDPRATEIIDLYAFRPQLQRLDRSGLLDPLLDRFAALDLTLDNQAMGYLFEALVRQFSEISNETAGEHFTPPEVVRLMVDLVLDEHDGPIDIFDPACGTGGMLAAAEDHLRARDPGATIRLYGQELNPESYAICRSDMQLRGQDPARIVLGNSLTADGHAGRTFDYMLANPPFGVDWRKVAGPVRAEAARGHAGRFGAGLPRITDGSLLFLQHMLAKMRPADEGGSRIAIVFNASPLMTGGAGSGESEIRRWILTNDLLEGVIGLPEQLFYNTGIPTYLWILSNRARSGRVVLLDARDRWTRLRRSLGSKRRCLTGEQAASIARDYRAAAGPGVKVVETADFGYRRISVDGHAMSVPLTADVEDHVARSAPGGRIDGTKTAVG